MAEERHLTFSPSSPAEARHRLRGALAGWDFDGSVNDAVLVLDEIVTNAIRHANGIPEVSIALRSHLLRIAVSDTSPDPPQKRPPTDDGGRGIGIVETLSSRWGVRPESAGKTVWADLPSGRNDVARWGGARTTCLDPFLGV